MTEGESGVTSTSTEYRVPGTTAPSLTQLARTPSVYAVPARKGSCNPVLGTPPAATCRSGLRHLRSHAPESRSTGSRASCRLSPLACRLLPPRLPEQRTRPECQFDQCRAGGGLGLGKGLLGTGSQGAGAVESAGSILAPNARLPPGQAIRTLFTGFYAVPGRITGSEPVSKPRRVESLRSRAGADVMRPLGRCSNHRSWECMSLLEEAGGWDVEGGGGMCSL